MSSYPYISSEKGLWGGSGIAAGPSRRLSGASVAALRAAFRSCCLFAAAARTFETSFSALFVFPFASNSSISLSCFVFLAARVLPPVAYLWRAPGALAYLALPLLVHSLCHVLLVVY